MFLKRFSKISSIKIFLLELSLLLFSYSFKFLENRDYSIIAHQGVSVPNKIDFNRTRYGLNSKSVLKLSESRFLDNVNIKLKNELTPFPSGIYPLFYNATNVTMMEKAIIDHNNNIIVPSSLIQSFYSYYQ